MEGKYLQIKAGQYVAWPLATPPHNFGDWSLVQIVAVMRPDGGVTEVFEFVRTLTQDEIDTVTKTFWVYGLKLKEQPWALVQGCPKAEAAEEKVQTKQRRPEEDLNPMAWVGV